MLANILNLFGVSPFTQQIVKGAIIVAAVLFEMHAADAGIPRLRADDDAAAGNHAGGGIRGR